MNVTDAYGQVIFVLDMPFVSLHGAAFSPVLGILQLEPEITKLSTPVVMDTGLFNFSTR